MRKLMKCDRNADQAASRPAAGLVQVSPAAVGHRDVSADAVGGGHGCRHNPERCDSRPATHHPCRDEGL
jgi:hypothetical protein